jgi:S-(hydroxymethyl)glutathione dehydrogenase/alcohol dehydrogenase
VKFRAAVMHEVGAPIQIEQVESGPLKAEDVLVRIRAASICHTDLDVLQGELAYPLPMILGHEAAGVVAEVGPQVTTPAVGEHVVLSWNPHCGHCFYCEHGQPILCEPYLRNRAKGAHFDGSHRLALNKSPLNVLMYLGGFAEYCIVPAQCAVPIMREIPFDRACLIGCGVMTGFGAATHIAAVRSGSAVAVIGCGAIGLSAIQGARLASAAAILAVDLDDRKLEVAHAVGATHVCNAERADPIAAVKAISNGRGADYAIEAAGNERALRLSLELLRPGGQVVWLGKVNVQQPVSFRYGALMGERRIVRSSYGGARPQQDFPRLARAYLDGKLKLDELITRRIGLDNINQGFDELKRGEAIRTVIEFPG